jgi:hypothetical protein
VAEGFQSLDQVTRQALGLSAARCWSMIGRIRCRQFLGGLLRHYYQAAA